MFPKRLLTIGLFAAALFAHAGFARAQWVQTNGPWCQNIRCFAIHDSILFAGTWANGLFRSTDNGKSWIPIDSGISRAGYNNLIVNALLQKGPDLFAATAGGVFVSANDGLNWSLSDFGLPELNADSQSVFANCLSTDGSRIFVGSASGVYVSTNNGLGWDSISSGFTGNDKQIFALTSFGSNLIAGTYGRDFISTDSGAHWEPISIGEEGDYVSCFLSVSTKLFAGTYEGGVFLSMDSGKIWTAMDSGLTNTNIDALICAGTNFYTATSGGGVFRSSDSGVTWRPVDLGLTDSNVNAIMVKDSNLFAGSFFSGVFWSSASTVEWEPMDSGLTCSISAITGYGKYALVGTDDFGVFQSTDNGSSWLPADSGLGSYAVSAFATVDTNLFVSTVNGGIYRLTNDGTGWSDALTNFSSNLTDTGVVSLCAKGTDLFAGTDNLSGVFRSSDLGSSWTFEKSALFIGGEVNVTTIGNRLIASGYGVIAFSTDNGSTWTSGNTGLTWLDVNVLFVAGSKIFAASQGSGVLISSDSGSSWFPFNSGLPETTTVDAFASSGSLLFAGTDSGVFLSTNGGVKWSNVSNGLINRGVRRLQVIGSNVFVGTDGSGVWRRPLSDFGISSVAQTPATPPRIQSYPNPFSQSTTISFTSEAQGYADVRVVNPLGMEVARIYTGELSEGEHSFSWDASGFAPGMYECVVRMNGHAERLPMIYSR